MTDLEMINRNIETLRALDIYGYRNNVIKQLKSSREDREALRDSLLFLSAAQKRVMELLGGFDDGGAKSMKEVAKMFAITPQRVWQIKHKAIKKLRQCFAEMRERSEL